ncbi:hypothetical protein HDV06_006868 [Boothiomyces sp. JEL0866]|nr:hypothetical protein HDV06_006868 [Boothiomyces sp. JEL0866]
MANLYFEKFFDKPFIPVENPENGSFLGNPKNGFGPILGPCISTTKYEFEQDSKTVQKVTLEIPDSVLPKKGKEFVGWGSPPLLPSGNFNTPRGFLEQVNNLDDEVQKLLNTKEEKPTPLVRKAFNPKDFIKKEQNQNKMLEKSNESVNSGDERSGRDRDRSKRERSITRSNSPPRKKSRNSPIKEKRDDRDGRRRQLSDPEPNEVKRDSFRAPSKDESREERKRDKSPYESRRDRSPRSDKSLKDTPKGDKSIRSTPRDDNSFKTTPKSKYDENTQTSKEKSDEQQTKTLKDKLSKSASIPAFVPHPEYEHGVVIKINPKEAGDWNLLGKAHKRYTDEKLKGSSGNLSLKAVIHYTAALLCYYTDLSIAMTKDVTFPAKKHSMEEYKVFVMKNIVKHPNMTPAYSLILYCDAFFSGYHYILLQTQIRKYNLELEKVLNLEELSEKERLSNFEIKHKKLSDSLRDADSIFEKMRGLHTEAYKWDPNMRSPFYGKPLGGSAPHGINGMGRARLEFLKLANDLGVYPCFIKKEGGTKEKPDFKLEANPK